MWVTSLHDFRTSCKSDQLKKLTYIYWVKYAFNHVYPMWDEYSCFMELICMRENPGIELRVSSLSCQYNDHWATTRHHILHRWCWVLQFLTCYSHLVIYNCWILSNTWQCIQLQLKHDHLHNRGVIATGLCVTLYSPQDLHLQGRPPGYWSMHPSAQHLSWTLVVHSTG